jgi:hypothetical protein
VVRPHGVRVRGTRHIALHAPPYTHFPPPQPICAVALLAGVDGGDCARPCALHQWGAHGAGQR